MPFIRNLAATAAIALVTLMAPGAKANQIISATGEIQLKSAGELDYRVVGLGARLKPGDIVRPALNANVTVLCNDSTIWIVPAGIPSGLNNGCPDRVAKGLRSDRWMYPEPGGSNPDIPFTISPRKKFILDRHPLLQWNPVPGASLYLVRLEGNDNTVWEMEVTDSTVVYPDDAPPLQPGVLYSFTVEADTGAFSDNDLLENYQFSLLDPATAAEVQAAVASIEQLDMNDEMEALAIAQLYQDNNLFDRAILTLENLVKAESQNPLVYQRLGILYGNKSGLNLLAAERYSQGIELAMIGQDSYILADCQAGLAAVKMRLGEVEQAEQIWQSAAAEYEALEDSESAYMLWNTIKQLKIEIGDF